MLSSTEGAHIKTHEHLRHQQASSALTPFLEGQPSLGYDVEDKKLIVNKAEAETVRHIFRRYIELKSVRLLKADLDAAGIVSKARTASDGSRYGQKPLARGALYLMLQNRIYRGETVHKDKNYPGEHEALVDEALWNEVQALLASNRVDRVPGTTDRQPSLLAGILVRRTRRADDAHACDEARHPLPLLRFPVIARREGQRPRPALSGGGSVGPRNAPHSRLAS